MKKLSVGNCVTFVTLDITSYFCRCYAGVSTTCNLMAS